MIPVHMLRRVQPCGERSGRERNIAWYTRHRVITIVLWLQQSLSQHKQNIATNGQDASLWGRVRGWGWAPWYFLDSLHVQWFINFSAPPPGLEDSDSPLLAVVYDYSAKSVLHSRCEVVQARLPLFCLIPWWCLTTSYTASGPSLCDLFTFRRTCTENKTDGVDGEESSSVSVCKHIMYSDAQVL